MYAMSTCLLLLQKHEEHTNSFYNIYTLHIFPFILKKPTILFVDCRSIERGKVAYKPDYIYTTHVLHWKKKARPGAWRVVVAVDVDGLLFLPLSFLFCSASLFLLKVYLKQREYLVIFCRKCATVYITIVNCVVFLGYCVYMYVHSLFSFLGYSHSSARFPPEWVTGHPSPWRQSVSSWNLLVALQHTIKWSWNTPTYYYILFNSFPSSHPTM